MSEHLAILLEVAGPVSSGLFAMGGAWAAIKGLRDRVKRLEDLIDKMIVAMASKGQK